MSGLFFASTIYADFDNLIYYTDGIVVETILRLHEVHELYKRLFKFPESFFTMTPPELYIELQSHKSELNILVSFFNWSSDVVEHPLDFCDELYSSIVNNYRPEVSEIQESNRFTSIGKALKVLTKDNNLHQLYVGVTHQNEYIMDEFIHFIEGSEKVKVVFGDTTKLLSETKFNGYFFKDTSRINIIARPHPRPTEIVIPYYEINLTTKIVELEGASIPNTVIDCDVSDEKLRDDFNLGITPAQLPI